MCKEKRGRTQKEINKFISNTPPFIKDHADPLLYRSLAHSLEMNPPNCLNPHAALATEFTKIYQSESKGGNMFQTKLHIYKKSLVLFKLNSFFVPVKTGTLAGSMT